MKRVVISAVILILLPLFALLVNSYMSDVMTECSETLRNCIVLADNGNWEEAYSGVETAQEKWKANHDIFMLFIQQNVVNSIDSAFDLLKRSRNNSFVFSMKAQELLCQFDNQLQDFNVRWTHIT